MRNGQESKQLEEQTSYQEQVFNSPATPPLEECSITQFSLNWVGFLCTAWIWRVLQRHYYFNFMTLIPLSHLEEGILNIRPGFWPRSYWGNIIYYWCKQNNHGHVCLHWSMTRDRTGFNPPQYPDRIAGSAFFLNPFTPRPNSAITRVIASVWKGVLEGLVFYIQYVS